MAEKERSKKRDDSTKFELGMGHLGMGGLFKGIKNLVDMVDLKLEKAGGEIREKKVP